MEGKNTQIFLIMKSDLLKILINAKLYQILLYVTIIVFIIIISFQIIQLLGEIKELEAELKVLKQSV